MRYDLHNYYKNMCTIVYINTVHVNFIWCTQEIEEDADWRVEGSPFKGFPFGGPSSLRESPGRPRWLSWNLPFTTLLGKVHGLKAGLGVEEKNSLDFSLVITQTNKDLTNNWVVATQIFFYVHPYIFGEDETNLTHFFPEGLKPPTRWGSSYWLIPSQSWNASNS